MLLAVGVDCAISSCMCAPQEKGSDYAAAAPRLERLHQSNADLPTYEEPARCAVNAGPFEVGIDRALPGQ